jgi:hypothetical protein
MDDYYEFMHAHDIQIEEWWLYWSPNYVSIIRGIVAPSVATTTFNISLTSESGGAIGIGAIGSGGTIRGGNVRASTSRHNPLPTFNPVVEFFRELQRNYDKVKIEKFRSLQDL